MIYLSSPYTMGGTQSPIKHHEILIARVLAAARAARTFVDMGYLVYSPVVHGHELDQTGKIPYGYWMRHSMEMLRKCDRLVVCDHIENWRESRGVKTEIGEWIKLEELDGRPSWQRYTEIMEGMGRPVPGVPQ